MDPKTLQAGMSGEDVKGMQLGLNKHLAGGGTQGPRIGDGTLKPLAPNGTFDAATANVVTAFQSANGLQPTGAIDRATRYAIFPLGVVSVMVIVERLRVPWLLQPVEPSWSRPPRLLPHLRLGDGPVVQQSVKPGAAQTTLGVGKPPATQPSASLDTPWLLYPHEPSWRSPPRLVPPLQMPVPDPAPRPAPVTAQPQARPLSPAQRRPDFSHIDFGGLQTGRHYDFSNIGWPIRPGAPGPVDWNAILSWTDDGTHKLINVRPLIDQVASATMPRPESQKEPASSDKIWVYDHSELQAGAQQSIVSDGTTPTAMLFSFQTVYRKGPDDGAHVESGWGLQAGVPLLVNMKKKESDLVSVNPYVYFTDVDRHWHFGRFHLWQPLAQVGFQATPNTVGRPWSPTLTATVSPINLELDPTDFLKINVQGTLAANISLLDASTVVGVQGSAAVTVQLEKFYSAIKPLWPGLFGR